MKRCPECIEEVLDAYIVCPRCGRELMNMGSLPAENFPLFSELINGDIMYILSYWVSKAYGDDPDIGISIEGVSKWSIKDLRPGGEYKLTIELCYRFWGNTDLFLNWGLAVHAFRDNRANVHGLSTALRNSTNFPVRQINDPHFYAFRNNESLTRVKPA